jgi:hypothetical protein
MSMTSSVPRRRCENREQAYDVVTDDSAGVADDVGMARLESQSAEDVQPGIHAGDDGQSPRRPCVEMTDGKALDEATVVGEELVDAGHGAGLRTRNGSGRVRTGPSVEHGL